MSREFHWTERCYAHEFLANTATDRDVTGEPITDAIGSMLTALAPLEYAAASYQRGDWGLESVKQEAIGQVLAIHAACATLLKAVTDYTAAEHVTDILDRLSKGLGGEDFHRDIVGFTTAQLGRGDLPEDVRAHAEAMRQRSQIALDMIAAGFKGLPGSFDIANELMRRQAFPALTLEDAHGIFRVVDHFIRMRSRTGMPEWQYGMDLLRVPMDRVLKDEVALALKHGVVEQVKDFHGVYQLTKRGLGLVDLRKAAMREEAA